jgi:hypothetical protein
VYPSSKLQQTDVNSMGTLNFAGASPVTGEEVMYGFRSRLISEPSICSDLRLATSASSMESASAHLKLIASSLLELENFFKIQSALAVAEKGCPGGTVPPVVVAITPTLPLVEMCKIYQCLDDVRDNVFSISEQTEDGKSVRDLKASLVDRISDLMQDIVEAAASRPCRTLDDKYARATLPRDWLVQE